MAFNDTAAIEFRTYLDKYIVDHDCYGLAELSDESGPRKFVPRSALEDFWTVDKLLNVLCRASQEERIPADRAEIMARYLVVFSILVSISRPELIGHFMSRETDDAHLPISSPPTDWTYVPEEFHKAQWRFCPLTFDRRRYMANLNPYHILPISNKKLLDSEADEEGDVVVYEALWHPSCLGLLPSRKVVFKVYHMRDEQVITSLLSEVDIYSNLEESAFDHIVKYFGSFEQQGKLTIVLEHARGGNLVGFLDETPPPTRLEDKVALWHSFFRLLLGLYATHNLNAGLGNQSTECRWLLKGIHQDIRPQNILITATEPDSYNIHFKLTDFGTGHVRHCRSNGVDMMGAQRRGNGMYSAPESYRDNNLTRPQLCECDIWSLGGVASELLVWSIKGNTKRLEYQSRRCAATRQTVLAGGYHEGSFHDGECRLSVVDNQHKALLDSIDKDDLVSPVVSSIILDHMLVATVGNRSSAVDVYQVWWRVLQDIRRRAGQLGSRWSTRDSHMSARSGLTQRQSVRSIPSSPPAFDPKASHEPWLESSHPISSEPVLLPGQRRSASRDDFVSHHSDGERHVQFEQQQKSGDLGPSSRYGGSVSGHERGTRRETNESSVLGSPFGSIPEAHNQENTFPIPNSFTPSFPLRSNGAPRLPRSGISLSNNGTFPSAPPSVIFRRQTAEEYHGITETGEDSTGRDHAGLGIDTAPTPWSPKTPPVEQTNTQLSRHLAQVSQQQGPATIPESTEITVDRIYHKIVSEGTSFLVKLLPRNKSGLLTDFPSLKVDLNKLKGTKGREQIFIVDDSVSMGRHSIQMGKTVRVLARLLKEGGVDPDKKMSLYFTCTFEQFSFKNAKDLEVAVNKRVFSMGPCDIGTQLDEIVSDILTGTSTNPVSIYVLTNGRWNANPEDEKDICGLEGIIGRILTSNKNHARQSNHVGFQFIRFYQHKQHDPEDIVAKKRLDYLDNCLADQFEKLGIKKSDIIDTTDWDEDVCKMLLGGVYADVDN